MQDCWKSHWGEKVGMASSDAAANDLFDVAVRTEDKVELEMKISGSDTDVEFHYAVDTSCNQVFSLSVSWGKMINSKFGIHNLNQISTPRK